MVLHEDSTLTWYSERGESSPEGGVLLKDAPEMIAAGQVSISSQYFPDLVSLSQYFFFAVHSANSRSTGISGRF